MKKFLALIALSGLAVSTAHAQSVIFQLTGFAHAKDSFGGAGDITNALANSLGTDFSDAQSATAAGAFALVSGSAVGNTMTVTTETIASSSFGAGFNFFIYASDALAHVETYILGAPGTPYSISINATGGTQVTDAGTGSSQVVGGTTGLNDPGWLFTWSLTGGTFTQTGTSDSQTLTYGGNLYSRVRPLPESSGSSFFGITGSPGFSGTGYYRTFQTVTTTVNNLGGSAPEPGTAVLVFTGGFIWIVGRKRR